MRAHSAKLSLTLLGVLFLAVVTNAEEVKIKLTGAAEVPATSSPATGIGTIKVNDDLTVFGSVTTEGMEGTMAHIHVAPVGKSGPPVITLKQTAPGVWSVPEGAKLTKEQYAAFKAGQLYVNVHSEAHQPGEIRGQLTP
jgi:hypothetical protein